MRNKVSIEKNIPISKMSGMMVSLLVKGILTQDKKYYSIHYKLIPYTKKCLLRLRNCSNGSKVKKINDLHQK